MRTKRGAERGSDIKYGFNSYHSGVAKFLHQVMLARATDMPWRNTVGQRRERGRIQTSGRSIRRGTIIFSIVGGLEFVGDLSHEFGL